MSEDIEFYAVQNAAGQYYRAKGLGGTGDRWVSELKRARIYSRIGPARSQVTHFSRDPKYPPPKLIRLIVSKLEVVDETERIKKSKATRERRTAKWEADRMEWELANAVRKYEDAKATLEHLKEQE